MTHTKMGNPLQIFSWFQNIIGVKFIKLSKKCDIHKSMQHCNFSIGFVDILSSHCDSDLLGWMSFF